MIGQVLPFGGLEFTIPLLLVALIVFVIVALVTGRRDPDPAGQRPYAIYLVLIIFVALFVALFSAAALASNMVQIPLSEQAGFVSSLGPRSEFVPLVAGTEVNLDSEHIKGAVQAGLVLVAALGILWFHVRRLREFAEEPAFRFSPGRRTYQVYLHAVTFVAVVILLFAAAAALYGVTRIVAPGTTAQFAPSSYERDRGITQAVTAGVLAIGAYVIAWYHWKRTISLREATASLHRPGGPPPPPPV